MEELKKMTETLKIIATTEDLKVTKFNAVNANMCKAIRSMPLLSITLTCARLSDQCPFSL